MGPSSPLLRGPLQPRPLISQLFSSSLILPRNCRGVSFPRVSGLCLPLLLFPSPRPSLGNCDFFFPPASPVVYPAGGCDVRDAQQQKITTSPSARRWPLLRALFIYLFRDAGGKGAGEPGGSHRGAGRARGAEGASRSRTAGLGARWWAGAGWGRLAAGGAGAAPD